VYSSSIPESDHFPIVCFPSTLRISRPLSEVRIRAALARRGWGAYAPAVQKLPQAAPPTNSTKIPIPTSACQNSRPILTREEQQKAVARGRHRLAYQRTSRGATSIPAK